MRNHVFYNDVHRLHVVDQTDGFANHYAGIVYISGMERAPIVLTCTALVGVSAKAASRPCQELTKRFFSARALNSSGQS